MKREDQSGIKGERKGDEEAYEEATLTSKTWPSHSRNIEQCTDVHLSPSCAHAKQGPTATASILMIAFVSETAGGN